jgi:hypothetical protein
MCSPQIDQDVAASDGPFQSAPIYPPKILPEPQISIRSRRRFSKKRDSAH